MPIICDERRPRSSRACSSEISLSLPSSQWPARRAVSACRSAGALPVRPAGLVRLGLRHHRVEVVVDEESPDALVRIAADELLDVDAPVPEHAAFAIGLRDLGLDRDDALEPGLEVRDLAHPARTLPDRDSASTQLRSRRADGPSRHPHSRRRDRAGADRGDATRPRGDGRRVRVGRPAGGRRRDGGGGNAAPRRDARVGQGERRRAQGPDHDADRHRLPLRQRRAAPRARALRLPAPVQDVSGRPLALRGRRRRRRPREHRRPVRGHRVRGGLRGGRARHRHAERAAGEADRRRLGHLGEADQRGRLRADHPLRVRVRARATAAARWPA